MNRLIVIDGNAILHRAFHALPPLTAPDGSLVNAVYGFASILFKLFNDFKPTHMAVAFDRPKPTFRKAMFDGYQAKRPKMDEGLVGQVAKVHELVRAFGIPIFEKDGFEADDIIGTLSTKVESRKPKAESENIDQVIIVTGDRDILQLVEDEKVLVFMPTKGLSEGKLYAEKDVLERMGVPPRLIPDLKGLMGDASDNYPGVAGVGPKTALKFLEKYSTLEGLLKSDELTEGQKKSAKLSHDLATIRTDVELAGSLDGVLTLDTPKVREFLEDLHFHSLLKRLNGSASSSAKAVVSKKAGAGEGEQQQLL